MTGSHRRKNWPLSLAAAPTSPSAYGFLLVLVATVAAKAYSAYGSHTGEGFLLEALGASASDWLIYPSLALLVAAGERTRRWLAFLTYPLSLLALLVALINAAYVAIANDQIDARVLGVGLNRLDEVADIALMEAAARAGRLGFYVLGVAVLGYFGIRLAWKRVGLAQDELGRLRVQGLALFAAFGVVLFAGARIAGLPRTLSADLIADNALVHTYVTWLDGAMAPIEKYEGAIELHFSAPMVAPGAMKPVVDSASAPNVLVLLLESTRFDHVELPMAGHESASRTPNLLALAQRGTYFTNVQAAMPHTSKSLVSIFCGRLPAMENLGVEVADGVLQQCLPELFRSAGYATAFIQSAIGSFEYRPRMTVRLGYDDFGAFETIGAAPLGYLAGDDRALPGAFASWLASVGDRRFFATILTSGTHHPYQLPEGVIANDPASGRSRYAALVEGEDRVLGALLEILRRNGRLDNTLILAVADHGEGLPGDAVRQHDNNFFEEALHVPMILAGPGVQVARNDKLLSLLDVTPTMLGAVGVANVLPDDELRFGADALHAAKARTYAPFACWNDQMCEGYVARHAKVIRMPADHRELAFDRGAVLQEQIFREPTEAELKVLDRVSAENAITRLSLAPLKADGIRLPSGFVCPPGTDPCVHPSRPEGGFHEFNMGMLPKRGQ